MKLKSPLISIVLPVYNEEEVLDEFFLRLKTVISNLNYEWEIIFVDDGSKDASWKKILSFCEKEAIFKGIRFSRNFGHQIAISAGIEFAKGDSVVIMDTDLQDLPELIPTLIEKWEEGYEVVYAIRKGRKDNLFKRTTAYFFYRILNLISEQPIPQDTGDFRLLDRAAVDALKRLKEKNRYMRGLTSWIGFSHIGIPFQREERRKGKSGYPLSKMINFAIDGILSFSTFPLKISSYLGFFMCIFSFVYLSRVLIQKFILKDPHLILGWTSLIASILLIGGLQFLILGIQGEYIARILNETRERPLYLIKEKRGFEEN